MLTREQNTLLTQTGAGTPCGDLMRRYWQPLALSEELPADGAPRPVRILGQDLALFRDQYGRPGLIGLHCSHRRSDLTYGRIEAGGLRCLYHGWVFDVEGRCLEQPGEPEGSTFNERVQHLAYPCQEAGGLIFTYMGSGEAPVLPAFDFLQVPQESRWVTKIYHECNYLQGNEGNIDPQHLSFLHRFLEPAADSYGGSLSSLTGRDVAPTISVEETGFGARIYTVRKIGQDRNYVRITNFIMPNLSSFAGTLSEPNGELSQTSGYQMHWHVPIDDTHHWKYAIAFRYAGPLDKAYLQRTVAGELTDNYHMKRNAGNRYLQDRDEMKDRTFSGLGFNFQAHDAYATESQEPILDRSAEHLGTTDRAIILARQMLLRSIRTVQEGGDPPFVIRDAAVSPLQDMVVKADVLPASVDWTSYWREPLIGGRLTPAEQAVPVLG